MSWLNLFVFVVTILAAKALGEKLHLGRFKSDNIIPDILDESPTERIEVKYGSVFVDMGNELVPSEVKTAPSEISYKSEPGKFYTLILADPDAPSRRQATYRSWQHWIVGNIPGDDVSAGETLTAYRGAGPPKDTGLHRYVFILFEQPGKIEFDEPRILADQSAARYRGKFSIRDFAAKYDLGNPYAGNFFQAKWHGSN